jgi:RluA family pseudouridine synthase
MKFRPEILYQDEYQLVVNKPSGLLSVPDRYDAGKPNLMDWLRERYTDIIKVHRIDKDTSGVICYARTTEAHRHLSLQFENHEIEKSYLALVDGQLTPTEGTIDRPIIPNPSRPGRMMTAGKGKNAITHYRVLETFQQFSWVEVTIETGRTHQIRVHLQYRGHALAVDEFYGTRNALALSEIKGRRYRLGKDQEERPLLRRLSLHAHRLGFIPYGKTEKQIFEAPLPKDLAVSLKQLQKWGQ